MSRSRGGSGTEPAGRGTHRTPVVPAAKSHTGTLEAITTDCSLASVLHSLGGGGIDLKSYMNITPWS